MIFAFSPSWTIKLVADSRPFNKLRFIIVPSGESRFLAVAVYSEVAEQQQKAARGVSRGRDRVLKNPRRGDRGERFKLGPLSLRGSVSPFHLPSHGSRRGLLSGATPVLTGKR